MAIASVSKSNPSSSTKKYKPGKTPTHTLSVCINPQEEDKSKRVYQTLAFLFPTSFGTDANALGGAEMLPREEDDTEIKKNPLVKFFVTVDRDGKNVLKKRVKASEEDEKGKFETVSFLEKKGGEIVDFVGEHEGKAYFVNKWKPKAK
jgi:hypothetical protein